MSDRSVCLITGGTSGIGLETAIRFAREGYDISLCARDEARLNAVADRLRSEFKCHVFIEPVDLSQPLAGTHFVDLSLSEFGRVDVLINNAGLAPNTAIEKVVPTELEAVLRVNVTTVFETVQRAWEPMQESGGGVIVNVSSLAAVDPFPGFSIYGGSKAFVETFTRAIADEGREHNIRAFCVRPGAVDTPLLRKLFPDFPVEQRLQPTDVANLIYSLTGESLRHSSGEAITIRK